MYLTGHTRTTRLKFKRDTPVSDKTELPNHQSKPKTEQVGLLRQVVAHQLKFFKEEQDDSELRMLKGVIH